jgi:MFS family permease
MTAVEGQQAAVEDASIPRAAEPPLPLRRNRDFNLIWSGQALSDMGTQMSTIAYPLLILAVTGSAARAGIVGSATIAGTLLLLLPAGVAADRWPRKKILVSTSIIQLVVGATVVPAIITHHIFLIQLILVGFLQGSALAFYTGASRGAVRRIVAPSQLPDAYARTQARDRAATMLGPPAGSALFSVAPYLPFALDSISFGAIAIAVSLLRKNLDPEKSSIPSELAEMRLRERVLLGLKYVFNDPFLRMVTLWATVINGVIAGMRLTSIVLAEQTGARPSEVGLMFTISAAVGLVGALLSRKLINLFGERLLVQMICWVFPACAAVMAVAPAFWLIGIMAGLTGFFLMPINVILLARAAEITKDHMQAQMGSAMQLCWTSLMALTPAIFGFVTEKTSARDMIWIAVVVYVIIAIWMLTRKSMTLLRTKKDVASARSQPA